MLGPLVVAGVCFSSQEVTKLKEMGVKDSKLLSPEKREELLPQLIKLASAYKIVVINAGDIDNRFNNNKNLNTQFSERKACRYPPRRPEHPVL